MTKYNELNATPNRNKKRVGRGIAAGGGKTAGRGTKGQKSRTGKKLGPAFDAGGHEHRLSSLPKMRGFKSLRAPAQVVYSDQLDVVKNTTIDNMALYEAGLIMTPYHAVKIIARGETASRATVKTQGMSKSVQAQLTKNGGKFEKTPVPNLPSSKKDND
ncbi:MAG: 50S ribosomal protein L15 [Candidatus Nomurabacteria bacterium]|jgi:large subunit ribosomal protein L15|nr:50S ribosomal protein L15 [Candidatus Nomurabacteria bacterium]